MSEQNPKIKVLYLDDEANNLQSFKAAFRRDYQVFTAQNSEEAFSILKTIKPHVIFSDQRMPVTTGVEFFNAVRQVFPDPVRVLITGFTDVQAIIEAINRGHIYRYITKPWSESEIRVAIENAYDLYQTRKQLESKIEDLEKANHQLNRFIYSASHDLRAPLATVLGVIRVARIELKDELAKNYLDKIQTTIEKLDILVNHIIDYYKNTRAENHNTEIRIADLLEDIMETIRSERGQGDALLDASIDQRAPFVADEFRLRIILSQLIANAIKFKKLEQDQARIDFGFSCDENLARISVKDHGIGILDDHLEQVFQMFFKTKEKSSGSGLGLFIVKEALEKMNGDIEVNSTPGMGTTFILKIPNHFE